MGKLTVPRPGPREKLQSPAPAKKSVPPRPAPKPKADEEIALDGEDLEEVDITEPSGPPVIVAPPVAVAPPPVVVAPPPIAVAPPPVVVAPAPVMLPPPPPAPVALPTPIWLGPPPVPPPVFEPPRPAMRSLATSLSDFERDSIRKSSPPVLERRKQLQKLVATAVGVAWFICIVAIGQMGLRSIIASLH